MNKAGALVLLSLFVLLITTDAKPQYPVGMGYGAQQTTVTRTNMGYGGAVTTRQQTVRTPMGIQEQTTTFSQGYGKK